jgi:hypothetical protein
MSLGNSGPAKEVQTRVKQKKDTSANWETYDPIILDGELVFVEMPDGDIRTKVGNGVYRYSELPFIDERFPKVSTSDDNKFLRVRDGKWVAETVPFSIVYTGEVEPVDDLGNDGDLYVQVDSI